jgi:hypothetical protein
MTKPNPTPHSGPGPTSPGDPFALTLPGVHVLAGTAAAAPLAALAPAAAPGGADGQQLAIPGLSLVLDQLGITVLKPDGEVGAVLPWPSVTRVQTVGRVAAPDGRQALVVEAATGARTHRFLVPTPDPDRLEVVIDEVVAARTGPAGRPGRRRGVAVAVVGILVIVLVVVLLVTVGGVKL